MAGGQGTRLRELTKDLIPKPMIEICGRPLLQWQIENLKENGINDIIVVVGHLSERIVTNNDLDKFNNIVSYYIEDKPLGTAGALLQIKDILEDEFFLIYGDLFFNIDLKANGFNKVNSEDIVGSSHDKITIEIYKRG